MSYTNKPFEELIPPPIAINDANKEYSTAVAVIVLGIVTSLTVLARLGQRFASRSAGADDYAIIPALLLYIGWTAMAAYMNLNSGIGKPLGDITFGEFILFYKGVFVAAWMYPPMSAAIRISILLFYNRLFSKADRKYKIIIYFLGLLQVVYVIIFEVLPAFSCRPLKDAWDPLKRYTSCTNLYIDATIALYSTSLAFDIILLVFPIYIVWRLQMPVQKRLSVSAIFFLGTCASIAAAYKLAVFTDQSNHWTPTDPHWFDYQASYYMPPQYNVYGKIFWIPSHVEPTVALIGTSIPALLRVSSSANLLFTKIRSVITNSIRSGSNRSHQSGSPSNSLRYRGGNSESARFQQISDSDIALYPLKDQARVHHEAT